MTNTTLYKKDNTGSTRSWNITIIPYDNNARVETIITTGLVGGAKTSVATTITEGKNVGRANETTPLQQAEFEAQSKITSKLKEGYVANIDDIKNSGELGSGIPAPMLAQKHHPTGEQKSSKTLKQLGILGKKIVVQPKLDGNRCLIKFENGIATMYTRSGDVMPVQLGHILNDVAEIASKYMGDETIILDGELFSHKFSFNRLNGLIKKEKATEEEQKERQQIKYHLYDVMFNKGYEYREKFIAGFASENIVVVPSYYIIATDENIKAYLEQFLADGEEGLMIRQLGIPYEHKRSWQLCKVKVFEDEEFEIVGFDEDKRGGFVGSFIVSDGHISFGAGASGQSEEERRYIWTHQQEYIGKVATVCFFGRSEYGVPRFPKFKGLR